MMWLLTTLSLLLIISWLFCCVQGHGRLIEPPSRSSMWRQGYSTPINYQDNELYCGGVHVQYDLNKGKCGVCGDPWSGPRENEVGGKYATGTLGRKYDAGQVIDVTVDLTANHKGYFIFDLCPKDDPSKKETEDCFTDLKIATTGDIQFPISTEMGSTKIDIKVRLPKGVRCRSCVLRWKYNAGNSWGTNPDGTGCVGCGNQEQFYGCADIAIGHDDVELGVSQISPTLHPESTTAADGKGNGNGAGDSMYKMCRNSFHSFGFLVALNVFVVVLLGLIKRP